jgi:hypothetical protein
MPIYDLSGLHVATVTRTLLLQTHVFTRRGGNGGQSMCTVGLMLSGCSVDDTLPGSPSFACGMIKKGDYITEV